MNLDPGSGSGRQVRKKAAPKKASLLLEQIREDNRSLNSSVSVIAQKIKHLARNEKILGQNLIVLNKKISTLKKQSDSNSGIPPDLLDRLEKLEKQMETQEARIAQLNDMVSRVAKDNLSGSQIKELEHIVKSINPLDFVTLSQMKDYVDSKLAGQRRM